MPLTTSSSSSGLPAVRPPSSARCLVVLVLVKAALAVVGFGRTFRLATARFGHREVVDAHPDEMVDVTAARVATVAALLPGRFLCLEQSLALWILLRRSGVGAALRFGVRPRPFGAHAWVEFAGRPVLENAEALGEYLPLPPLPEVHG